MAGEPVVRIRRVQVDTDRYGNPVWGDVEAELEGAFFAPGGSRETVAVGGTPIVTEPTLYFPKVWPDLVVSDRVRVRGVTYEVEGHPQDWQSPWGSRLGGLVVSLKLAEGGA